MRRCCAPGRSLRSLWSWPGPSRSLRRAVHRGRHNRRPRRSPWAPGLHRERTRRRRFGRRKVRGKVCGNVGAPPSRYRSVVVFAFENRTWSDVGAGFGPEMPYLHALGERCSWFTDWTETDTGAKQPDAVRRSGHRRAATGDASTTARRRQRAARRPTTSFANATAPGLTRDQLRRRCDRIHAAPRGTRSSTYRLCTCGATTTARTATIKFARLPSSTRTHSPRSRSSHRRSATTDTTAATRVVDRWAQSHLQPCSTATAYAAGKVAVFIWYDEDHPVPNLWLAPTARPRCSRTRGRGLRGNAQSMGVHARTPVPRARVHRTGHARRRERVTVDDLRPAGVVTAPKGPASWRAPVRLVRVRAGRGGDGQAVRGEGLPSIRLFGSSKTNFRRARSW